MENKGIVIEFCNTGFCSIPGRYTFSMFSSRIGYGDKSFLRECVLIGTVTLSRIWKLVGID